MNSKRPDPIDELVWLAYAAQQRGWDTLAARIAEDVLAARERRNELKRRRQEKSNKHNDSNKAA